MKVPGLIRVVPEPAFHIAGIRLRNPCHQIIVFSGVIKYHWYLIENVFDCSLFSSIRLPLYFLLGPMVVLLHKHKYGTYASNAGGYECSRKEDACDYTDTRCRQQSISHSFNGFYLIKQAEFIYIISRKLDVFV